jgi:hypothetical protein
LKYQSEDYFSVLDKKTGKKLMDCGLEQDALAMVAFDPQNRTYTRNKFLMGPVIDIEIPKQLPTNEVVSVKKQQPQKLNQYQNKLPQSELQQVDL